jgi:hypothetical protein
MISEVVKEIGRELAVVVGLSVLVGAVVGGIGGCLVCLASKFF